MAPPTLSGATRLLGLIGHPVAHSLSPAMHNAAAAALGLDVAYVPFAVTPARLGAALRGAVALGLVGVNVTVPHKSAVLPFLDEIDPAARAIGAVNTIVVGADGALQGSNTDAPGFLRDLQSLGIEPAGLSSGALVLGAGGAARGVVYALASAGCPVTVASRRAAPAQQLAADLRPHVAAALDTSPLENLGAGGRFGLIVNATPAGMTPHVDATPWPAGVPLPGAAFFYDLVYSPAETTLLRRARAAGARGANGLGMLVWQGALAFERWLGVTPDVDVMRAAAETALYQK